MTAPGHCKYYQALIKPAVLKSMSYSGREFTSDKRLPNEEAREISSLGDVSNCVAVRMGAGPVHCSRAVS
jgi:hypothetical protein